MIPVCRPFLLGNEMPYVLDALETRWISSAGKYIEKFEKSFADFVGVKHAVSCVNGTAACHLALIAAGVGKGDRVVVPSFTMMASVFPIIQLGAEPVFVDCEEDIWTLDPKALDRVEGPVKAIMPVHIYGHPCDMDPIEAWAKDHDAIVIEDAAEAHGALYKGQPCGSMGTVSAFSFFANKILTTGEGGMVVTNDDQCAQRVRYYKNLCFDPDPDKRFIHADIGMNYRMTNISAAIGFAQCERAADLVAMRIGMARKYLARFDRLRDTCRPQSERSWAKNVFWMFGIVLNPERGIDAATLRNRLKDLGVETRRFFYPGHRQPVFRGMPCAAASAPISEKLWDYGLYLPSSSDLTDDEADQVCLALEKATK